MRTVRVHGICLTGAQVDLVTVEARFERADRQRTEVLLSGLPDAVIRESRGRLLSALEENRLHLPQGRLFLNLAPAGVKKSGEALDLPLALGAAAATGHLAARSLKMLEATVFLGELGIDGRLHPVPGGLAAADVASRAGLTRLVGPGATAAEAAWLPGIQSFAAEDLAQVVAWLVTGEGLSAVEHPPSGGSEQVDDERRASARAADRLDIIRGQESAKEALCVAAAGDHNLLLIGPPGTGKSLLARALVTLLPSPTTDERISIQRVLSASGRWSAGGTLERPFRAPHHTTSYAGLVGGSSPPRPGEVTLAHEGVLFLDELPEFRREALEALRQPIENGAIIVSRAGRQHTFPAEFRLACAMNPCPCGYRGHPRLACRCSASQVRRYRQRISGPLLDRIDLRLEVRSPGIGDLEQAPPDRERGHALRERVLTARARMQERQGTRSNARLSADELDRHAPLGQRARHLLERASERHGLSARALQSIRRVGRTAADLEGSARVLEHHFAQALALRGEL